MSWNSFPLIEENRLYAIGRNITAQKLTLFETQRPAAIVKSAGDAILSFDRQGTVTSWNVGAERIYVYTQEEMLGCNVRQTIQASVWRRLQREPRIIL